MPAEPLSNDEDLLVAEIEKLDELAAVRARKLLGGDWAPIEIRHSVVLEMLRARLVGLGRVQEDPGLAADVRAALGNALEAARGFAMLERAIDPSWGRTATLVADVLEALCLADDHREADAGAIHTAALSLLERHGRRPAATQREFLEDVLRDAGPLRRDQEQVTRASLGMLARVYDQGPRFGIMRTVGFRAAVHDLEDLIDKRFARSKGWDDLTGELKAKRVLRDVLVAVGMDVTETETALRKVGTSSGRGTP